MEPITSFFSISCSNLFGFTNSATAFLIFMAILIIIGKLLVDRKNRIMHWIGFGELFLPAWLLFWYAIEINLLVSDSYTGVSIFPYLELLACLFMLVFIGFSLANAFNLTEDHEWSLIVALVCILIEGVMFILPLWYTQFNGNPVTSLVFVTVISMIIIVLVYLTEKLSIKRLK